jgi:putative ABC transport system ATP-binding protein
MRAVAGRQTIRPAAIVVKDVQFRWRKDALFTLRVPEFQMDAGERVLLLGPSGSGKSTLLNLLCGIAVPQSGSIQIAGTDLSGMTSSARDRFRAAHMGIIFQMFNLLPYLSPLDNVLLPLTFAPPRRARATRERPLQQEAMRLLERLRLDPAVVGQRRAAELSVGQQQRVAAARALIGSPDLVIADEPTSALDRSAQLSFIDLLSEEIAASASSLIMVSHDESLAERFNRAVLLSELTGEQIAGEPA